MTQASEQVSYTATPHNLGLYRLDGFYGARRQLLTLHQWLAGEAGHLPAIAISGEQGNGKSAISTAAAWNLYYHFSDGIIRVGAAGTNPFRLYDVIRTLDTVLGTTLTRVSEDRWGISILEQLYRRKRLLIVDKLAGATEAELDTLVDIIGHLHEAGGLSRILLIDRNFSPQIARLVQEQHLHLDGLDREDVAGFIRSRGPVAVQEEALRYADDLFAVTGGRPLPMRLVLGLLLDFRWPELHEFLLALKPAGDLLPIQELVALAVENYAVNQPQVGPLLNHLVSAAGGASIGAFRSLFWDGLGSQAELDEVLTGLTERALLEVDAYEQRIVLHAVIRRYLNQNAVMLGEEWERSHARFYLPYAERYQYLPQHAWSEIDVEWGNIYQGMDWCTQRLERLWQQSAYDIIADPAVDKQPVDLPNGFADYRDDLRLTRAYSLALAYYAFWRHPLGTLRWLSAGALASLALRDYTEYAWLLTNIGRQLFFHNRVEEALTWLNRARRILDDQDRVVELSYVFTDLGTSYRILDEPRQALEHFYAAFDCVAQTADQDALTTAYLNLGSAYYSLNDFERALREQRKALRIALRRHDRHSVASAFNNMGLALEGLDNFIDAQAAYERSLTVFQEIEDITGISTCYNNLGSACYARGDFEQAHMWYKLDLALSEERGNWTDMAATLHNLGHVALEQKDRAGALAYFERSRILYSAFELVDYVAEEEEMIAYLRSLDNQA
ncbi:MAG: tetratricopeptide repeat protein [Caldilineaceae bacterium]|nr:tetratricopeptide repeat protein [Caldilineaceae bacterium]